MNQNLATVLSGLHTASGFLDHEGEDILDVTFFTDEAYCHLSGFINTQKSQFWCAQNPHAFHESPLHNEKIGVWVGMSRRHVVGLISLSRRLSTPNGTVTLLCIPSLCNWKTKLTRPTFSRMALQLICLWHSWTRCLRTESFLKPFGLQDLQILLCPIFFLGCNKNSVYVFERSPHNWWAEDGHHRIHSECGLSHTEHGLQEQFGVSINVWRLAGDTLNITCNFLYCNHQVHRDFLITLYLYAIYIIVSILIYRYIYYIIFIINSKYTESSVYFPPSVWHNDNIQTLWTPPSFLFNGYGW